MTIQQIIDYLKCQYGCLRCRDCSLYCLTDDCELNVDDVMSACIDVLERIEKCNDKSATKCHECISLIKDKYKEECK